MSLQVTRSRVSRRKTRVRDNGEILWCIEKCGIDVLSNEVQLACSFYVEVDESLLPTGRLLPVEGTPFDFREQKTLGKDIKQLTSTRAGALTIVLSSTENLGRCVFFVRFTILSRDDG